MDTALELTEYVLASWDTHAPKNQQLYEALRAAILDGIIASGTKLPASRSLARSLGLGRNTVLTAYEQLLAEGYVATRRGAGTYVSDTLPDPAPRAAQPVGPDSTIPPAQLSRRGETIAAAIEGRTVPGTRRRRAFMPNIPDERAFPWALWQRLLTRHIRQGGIERHYTRDGGNARLRAALTEYLRLTRTVRCRPEQVIITGSTQQSLALLATALADPGDTAWVEDPGYQGASAAFTAAGLDVAPVPVDSEGLYWQASALPRPKLIYVTPSHQYPMGAVMSLRRRQSLIAHARACDAWIIEDDYDGEFRHEGRPLASLQGLDDCGRVIYLGTFSKALYPGIRVAYLIVPEALVDRLTAINARLFREGQHLTQAALADFIVDGHFAAHIRRTRVLYRRRRDTLTATLQETIGGQLQLLGGDAGMHIVAELPTALDDMEISRRAAALGIAAPPLSAEYLTEPDRSGLILGYAAIDQNQATQGALALGSLLRGWL